MARQAAAAWFQKALAKLSGDDVGHENSAGTTDDRRRIIGRAHFDRHQSEPKDRPALSQS